MIGLPAGQEFNLSETAPFSPLTSLTQDQALATALAQRPDYQSGQARVRAAEDAVRAARGERYPTAGVTADYGDVGPDACQLPRHVHLRGLGQDQCV